LNNRDRISIENNAGIIGRFSQILEAGLVMWWKRTEENLPEWSKECKDVPVAAFISCC